MCESMFALVFLVNSFLSIFTMNIPVKLLSANYDKCNVGFTLKNCFKVYSNILCEIKPIHFFFSFVKCNNACYMNNSHMEKIGNFWTPFYAQILRKFVIFFNVGLGTQKKNSKYKWHNNFYAIIHEPLVLELPISLTSHLDDEADTGTESDRGRGDDSDGWNLDSEFKILCRKN